LAIASPERVRAGLEFVKCYYHANGVTLGSEPGGIASKKMEDVQNAVLSDSSSLFRLYWDLGYQLHVHVNGDAGLDRVLD
jgi:predicted amidohydrolase YtcJ